MTMTTTKKLVPMTFEQYESLSRAASKAVRALADLHDAMAWANGNDTLHAPMLTDTVDRLAGRIEEWEATLTYLDA